MKITAEQKSGLSVALNEATLLGLELNTDERRVGATFDVLALPEHGPKAEDRRVLFVFWPIGHMAVSFVADSSDDADSEILPVEPSRVMAVVQSLGGQPIYGWEFFDQDRDFATWEDRLSLDYRAGDDGLSESITLFQEGHDQFLILRIWFDELQIQNPDGTVADLDEFVAAGQRWWEGMHAGDPRALTDGIVPMKPAGKK